MRYWCIHIVYPENVHFYQNIIVSFNIKMRYQTLSIISFKSFSYIIKLILILFNLFSCKKYMITIIFYVSNLQRTFERV